MDRFTSLTAFVHVVENGGFSAAARRLNMSTTMVSNHVQALEDRLGVRLLNRTTRKVSLTEIGKAYYDRSADSRRSRTGRRHRERIAVGAPRHAAHSRRHAHGAPCRADRGEAAVDPCGTQDRSAHGRGRCRSHRGGLRRCPPHDPAAGFEPDRAETCHLASRALLLARLSRSTAGCRSSTSSPGTIAAGT